jgi:hypothetical protein
MFWVGFRDLEITFLVVDADSGDPISAAVIDIPKTREGLCQGCEGPFRFVTNQQGVAKHLCKHCMCSGFSGWRLFFRHVESFGSHTPGWVFDVSAPGFQKIGEEHLFKDEILRTMRRGDQFATMEVAIQLHRLPPGK